MILNYLPVTSGTSVAGNTGVPDDTVLKIFPILASLNLNHNMNDFSIQQQLTLKEYRKVYYTLLYSKIWVICITVFSALYLIATGILLFTKNYAILGNDSYQYGATLTIITILLPLLSLLTVSMNFKRAYRLDEPTTYQFSDHGFTSTAESYNCKTDWKNIYKVRIIKGWLVLYHNRQAANLVKLTPKDEVNIEALKAFLKNGNFKAKLKW